MEEHLRQIDAVERGGHVEYRGIWVVWLALDCSLDAPDQTLVTALHKHGRHVCEALHTRHRGHHVSQVAGEDHRELEQVTRHADRPDARLRHRLVDATKSEREHRGADRAHVGDRVRCREVDVWEVLLNPRRISVHSIHDLLHRGRAAEVRQLLQRLLHVPACHRLRRHTIGGVLPRGAEPCVCCRPPLYSACVVERRLLVHQFLVEHPLEVLARPHLLIERVQRLKLFGTVAVRADLLSGCSECPCGLAHDEVRCLVQHHPVHVLRDRRHPQQRVQQSVADSEVGQDAHDRGPARRVLNELGSILSEVPHRHVDRHWNAVLLAPLDTSLPTLCQR